MAAITASPTGDSTSRVSETLSLLDSDLDPAESEASSEASAYYQRKAAYSPDELEAGFEGLGEKPAAADLAAHVERYKDEEGLLAQLYSGAKALLPASLSDLQKKVSDGYARLKKFVEEDAPKGVEQGCIETLKKLGGEFVVMSVEQCKADLKALKGLMNDTVAYLAGTSCIAFLKKLFYNLFYARPLKAQIEKTEKTLAEMEKLEAQRQALTAEATTKVWKNAVKGFNARLDDIDARAQAFIQETTATGRKPHYTDQDRSAALESEAYKVFTEAQKLERSLKDHLGPDAETSGSVALLCRVANISVALGKADRKSERFLFLQGGASRGDLSFILDDNTAAALGALRGAAIKEDVDAAIKPDSAAAKLKAFLQEQGLYERRFFSREDLQELRDARFDFSPIKKAIEAKLMGVALFDSDRMLEPGTEMRRFLEKVAILAQEIPAVLSPYTLEALKKLEVIKQREAEQRQKAEQDAQIYNAALAQAQLAQAVALNPAKLPPRPVGFVQPEKPMGPLDKAAAWLKEKTAKKAEAPVAEQPKSGPLDKAKAWFKKKQAKA